jgi:hypothetical protein
MHLRAKVLLFKLGFGANTSFSFTLGAAFGQLSLETCHLFT